MFTVYHSNQLDLLQRLTASIITKSPLRDPFEPEVILVQGKAMAQWVQLKMAAHLGIAANITFLRPRKFIWKALDSILPRMVYECTFSKSEMAWRIMALLPRLCQKADFLTISQYLCADPDQRKRFQLATRIADLFDKYLVYRADWLEGWQKDQLIDGVGSTQCWQSVLWRTLTEEAKKAGRPLRYFNNLDHHFIQTISQNQSRPPGLPDRVFIFAIPSLPPSYLQVLKALGCHIDIYMLLINPCRYYWGDILDRAFFVRLLRRRRLHHQTQKKQRLFRDPRQAAASVPFKNKLKRQHIAAAPSLLVSWGKQANDNLHLLEKMEGITEIDAFVEPVGDNLLCLLQRDIIMHDDYTAIGMTAPKRLLQLNDRSLSLHGCHSPQREVEVLHDSLLALIAEDPTLLARDILVMMVNIDQYAPAIQAVFGNNGAEFHIPFTISDGLSKPLNPVFSAFLGLLELPGSRCSAEQILALLEVPALASRFEIDEKMFQLLSRWVAESGIRWGLDDDTASELMLPVTGQHTWQFGINRMLLGYAMDSEHGVWKDILPYDDCSGLIARLAGNLAELLVRLRKWKEHLGHPRSLDDWINCAQEIIKDFFSPDAEEEISLALLKNKWREVLQVGLQAEYDQPVPITMLREELSNRLNTERVSHHFLRGAVNFCTLTPMRSIPFRVVCLLGMNDGIFPRTSPPVEFDLMIERPRRGDYSARDDDRCLFLEAMLAARDRFYISFIGYFIHNNTPRHPSVLVNELSDYITQRFHFPGDEKIKDEDSASRVRAHLWQWHSRTPFAPENFIPGCETQSFASKWLFPSSSKRKELQNFVVPLTAFSRKKVTLDELLFFYRHPVRAWFIRRLSIPLCQNSSEPVGSSEPFVVDSLTRYQINKRLVNALIDGENTELLFCKVRSAGLLPYGVFGEIYWAKQCREMTPLSQAVRIWKLPDTYNLEIDLSLDGGMRLSGWLPRIQENGLLRWRPGTLSARDGLQIWIKHLVYCAMGGQGNSRMFGILGKWHFSPLPIDHAKYFLASLVEGYYNGMVSPLLLLPRSGGAWISYCYDPVRCGIDYSENLQKRAHDKIIQVWEGTAHSPGEKKDPYLNRLINQLNKKHIKEIISTSEQYFCPPFSFNLENLANRKEDA